MGICEKRDELRAGKKLTDKTFTIKKSTPPKH